MVHKGKADLSGLSGLSIGRRPGVPDKPTDALGAMTSAQTLVCFIAHISNFQSHCGLGRESWNFRTVSVPSVIVHSHYNGVARQSNLPACLAWDMVQQDENTLGHLCHITDKLTDKLRAIHINGKFSAQEPNEWNVFSCLQVIFTVFQPKNLDWFQECSIKVKSECFENWLGQWFLQLSRSCQTQMWKSFSCH